MNETCAGRSAGERIRIAHAIERQDDYASFIQRKTQAADGGGFTPVWMPEVLFDFQRAIVEWALRKGRAALFVDTGLGKTIMQLVWAENVVRHTGRPVIILAPLAVSNQTIREGKRFGITVTRASARVSDPGIYIANYERLHHLSSEDFIGLVCDESSILKSSTGETKKAVVRFALKLPYRLLATATPSPNDHVELGTSSEALGYLGYSEMLTRFFKQTDAKGSRIEDVKRSRKDREIEVFGVRARDGDTFAKLSYRVVQDIGGWRLKGHAVTPFWRWVASWARACRKPSDVGSGFNDARFVLPELTERHHVVKATRPPDGQLFTMPAFGLGEEREERRRTMRERCELVRSLCTSEDRHLIWCQLNQEGDMIESLIPGCVQVSGADSEEFKEAAVEWFQGHTCVCGTPLFKSKFQAGECTCGHKSGRRVLCSKASIFGYGINLQTCAHVVTFASHSFEDYYQCVRRCHRFGQTRPVIVDIISTEGEIRVRDSMQRKSRQASQMFDELVTHMRDAQTIARPNDHVKEATRIPWLSSTK
jgi:hypothetical protein